MGKRKVFMREKTDLTEVVLQGQLVDYLLATGAFAVPKLYPEVLYRRWDALQAWYLSAERSPEMREYVAVTVVRMFACPDPRAQMAALELGWQLRIDKMFAEMERVVTEGMFNGLQNNVQGIFLDVVAKGQLSGLADFAVHQVLKREELASWFMFTPITFKEGNPLGLNDLWRIQAVARYYEKLANRMERQQIMQMSRQWVELQQRVGASERLSELLQLFLDEHAQTYPLFSSKVQELLADLERDSTG